MIKSYPPKCHINKIYIILYNTININNLLKIFSHRVLFDLTPLI